MKKNFLILLFFLPENHPAPHAGYFPPSNSYHPHATSSYPPRQMRQQKDMTAAEREPMATRRRYSPQEEEMIQRKHMEAAAEREPMATRRRYSPQEEEMIQRKHMEAAAERKSMATRRERYSPQEEEMMQRERMATRERYSPQEEEMMQRERMATRERYSPQEEEMMQRRQVMHRPATYNPFLEMLPQEEQKKLFEKFKGILNDMRRRDLLRPQSPYHNTIQEIPSHHNIARYHKPHPINIRHIPGENRYDIGIPPVANTMRSASIRAAQERYALEMRRKEEQRKLQTQHMIEAKRMQSYEAERKRAAFEQAHPHRIKLKKQQGLPHKEVEHRGQQERTRHYRKEEKHQREGIFRAKPHERENKYHNDLSPEKEKLYTENQDKFLEKERLIEERKITEEKAIKEAQGKQAAIFKEKKLLEEKQKIFEEEAQEQKAKKLMKKELSEKRIIQENEEKIAKEKQIKEQQEIIAAQEKIIKQKEIELQKEREDKQPDRESDHSPAHDSSSKSQEQPNQKEPIQYPNKQIEKVVNNIREK